MGYTLAQLAAEITNDPKALGYAAPVAAGSLSGLAALINGTYPGVGTVWRTDVAAAELLGGIVWAEVSGFTAAQWEAVEVMLVPLTVDASNANVRAFFAGVFAGKTATIANLTAIAQRANPSRAEELWGYGTVVSTTDIAHALGRT
jgi:hypothetical protein